MEGGKEDGLRIFPVGPLQNMRKWPNFETKKMASEHRGAIFYCEHVKLWKRFFGSPYIFKTQTDTDLSRP